MLDKATVVIVGGGVTGTSIAYHLAKRGVDQVVVVERDLLASGSTGLAAGGIRQQFSTEANIRIMLESVKVFERFPEEFDTEIDFHQWGYLFLATTEEDWRAFQESATLQKSLGLPVELLSLKEIRELAPYLYLDDVIGGTFCPTDGYADPYSVAMGFAKKARELGVEIYEETEVVDIEVEDGRVREVVTNRGEIATPMVVNATGAWAAQIGRMVGVELPIKPYRRQVFVTAPFEELPKRIPMVIDFAPSFYFRREGPGILMGMSDKEEPSSFNTNVDWNFLTRVVEKAAHRAPVLERAGIKDGWGGLYAITPDHNPILGPISGVEGFICAAGFSGHGFMQAPAVGRLIAELITSGETFIDLKPFRFERLAEEVVTKETRVI